MAIEFDNTDDYLTWALPASLTRPFTIGCWVNHDGTQGTIVEINQAIGTKIAAVRIDSTNHAECAFGAAGVIVATDPSTLSNGWHYLAGWCDDTQGAGSDTAVLYVDGVLVDSTVGTEASTGSMARITVGAAKSGLDPYGGAVAEVAVWYDLNGDVLAEMSPQFTDNFFTKEVAHTEPIDLQFFARHISTNCLTEFVSRATATITSAPVDVAHQRIITHYRNYV